MARPSNKQLMARVRELEEKLESAYADDTPSDQPMPLRVRGLLKQIIRHPENAKWLAEQALRHI